MYENHIPPEWKKQFINLNGRIVLLKWTIMFAAFGLLFNLLTVFALYLDEIFKKYSLSDAKKAHEELEARLLKGPAVIIPN